ncbi:exocyst complex component 6B [Corvus kubaryi]|uniref:exocyst complex component 6B n=1 Tax=Corvus kubaryi TaxID=68294 RepID=UPI001C04CE9E|nr:exocyst complex component 6B [Corvus kubaryi]
MERPKMAELESLETAAEHERILREIESTDTACIGPTLRSVYDGEEHGRFMEKLEARIRNHDREIEKMCNFHYQGFVDSITELLKVRGEAQKLKNQVTDTNRKLQNEGKELILAMEELKQCRLQQRNISATVDKLTLCLPVLEMYSKLREQMKSKRHYPALKTLEHLEHTFLPQVSHYRFCKVMVDNIPRLREEIKELSMSDLKDFLESIRKHSDKIGETAMKQAQQQRNLDNIVSQQPRISGGKKSKKEFSASSELEVKSTSPMSEQDSGILDVEDEDEEEEVPGAQDLVDFSPVYRCLHIYSVLVSKSRLFWDFPALRNSVALLLHHLSMLTWNVLLKEERLEPAAKLGVFAVSAFHARIPRNWHPFTWHGPGFGSTGAETLLCPSQLVQIIINTTHLEKSCKFLEEFITNITNVLPETVHTTKLYGTTTFKDARHAAEEEIYTNLNQKIDQFLQLADYDWMALEPGSRASDYLVDLIGFLRSTFAVFTHLPGKVAQTACMSACKHLSTSLLQLLLEAEVRQLTLGALHQFNLDVEECEQFARSGPVPGFQGDTLQLAFIDLRQPPPRPSPLFHRCSLASNDKVALGEDGWGRLHPSVATSGGGPVGAKLTIAAFPGASRIPKSDETCRGDEDEDDGDEDGRAEAGARRGRDGVRWFMAPFLLCQRSSLVELVAMRDTSRKNNVFAQFRKNERDKQKLIDTVAKQLRGLINSHHS